MIQVNEEFYWTQYETKIQTKNGHGSSQNSSIAIVYSSMGSKYRQIHHSKILLLQHSLEKKRKKKEKINMHQFLGVLMVIIKIFFSQITSHCIARKFMIDTCIL